MAMLAHSHNLLIYVIVRHLVGTHAHKALFRDVRGWVMTGKGLTKKGTDKNRIKNIQV